MDKEITLLILIGLPGTGKTFFSETLLKKQTAFRSKIIHICFDKIIPFSEKSKFKEERQWIGNEIQKLIKSIKSDTEIPEIFNLGLDELKLYQTYLLILDDNMYYRSMRYKYFKLAQNNNLKFYQLFFNDNLKNLLEVNKTRPEEERLPEHIIEDMFIKIEPPCALNSWEVESEIVHRDAMNDEFYSRLMLEIRDLKPLVKINDEEESVFSKSVSDNNIIHQVDIISRQILNEKIKNLSVNERKLYSKSLNNTRVELMTRIRKGIIKLPSSVEPEKLHDFVQSYFSYL